MKFSELDLWQKAADTAELSPMTQSLPVESPAGTVFEISVDGERRKWLRVEILSGNSGSRWAYWAAWPGIGPHPEFKAIADNIFNGDAAHFIGMLGVPYVKIPNTATLHWVLVEPRMVEPRKPWIFEEETKERYEKSKESYDVDTHRATKFP